LNRHIDDEIRQRMDAPPHHPRSPPRIEIPRGNLAVLVAVCSVFLAGLALWWWW